MTYGERKSGDKITDAERFPYLMVRGMWADGKENSVFVWQSSCPFCEDTIFQHIARRDAESEVLVHLFLKHRNEVEGVSLQFLYRMGKE